MKNLNRQYQMPKTSITFIYLFLLLLSLYDFGKIYTIVLKNKKFIYNAYA